MYKGDRTTQRKIMQIASVSGDNVYTRDRLAIDNALDMVNEKTIDRRNYLKNTVNVGPDYRMV